MSEKSLRVEQEWNKERMKTDYKTISYAQVVGTCPCDECDGRDYCGRTGYECTQFKSWVGRWGRNKRQKRAR